MKTRKVRMDVTVPGLYQWYKSLFARFGWMMLAKHYGMTNKLTTYKRELNLLCDSICERLKTIHDDDNKEDLTIMQKNVEILIRCAKKEFK
jgi:hypothetical protein